MEGYLPKAVMHDIAEFARKNNIKKVTLFGSRARRTNTKRSDIDLAVNGGDAFAFYLDLEEFAHTLLTFDVVDLDREISIGLKNEIEQEGVVLYEKI